MIVISPEVEEEGVEALVSRIKRFVTDGGGSVAGVENWGKKKLAYPIKHFMEGNYVLARFSLKPKLSKELEANLKISEEVLRHLLVRLDS